MGECQPAFLGGRQILIAALITNKVVDGLLKMERVVFYASWIWKKLSIMWPRGFCFTCWIGWVSVINGVVGLRLVIHLYGLQIC